MGLCKEIRNEFSNWNLDFNSLNFIVFQFAKDLGKVLSLILSLYLVSQDKSMMHEMTLGFHNLAKFLWFCLLNGTGFFFVEMENCNVLFFRPFHQKR